MRRSVGLNFFVLVPSGDLPLNQMAQIATRVVRTVDCLHANGFVHGDISTRCFAVKKSSDDAVPDRAILTDISTVRDVNVRFLFFLLALPFLAMPQLSSFLQAPTAASVRVAVGGTRAPQDERRANRRVRRVGDRYVPHTGDACALSHSLRSVGITLW